MNSIERKRYTAEFKATAVDLLSTGKPVSQVAEELCISSTLRQENDILKKAAIILGTRAPSNSGK